MFTSTATPYGSLKKEQIYSSTSTTAEDQIYTIKLSQSGETLGVKKFYNIKVADLNVSPIVRPHAEPVIPEYCTGYVDQSAYGAISISVTKSDINETNDENSESCVLTLSKSTEGEVGLISSLHTTRYISLGERELLALRVNPMMSLRTTVEHYAFDWSEEEQQSMIPITSASFVDSADDSGIAVFSLTAGQLNEGDEWPEPLELERIVVRVEQFDESADTPEYQSIAELIFYVIEPPRTPMRLAWISSRGSIEHYTMPNTTSELYLGGGRRLISLRSALETMEVRRAIAEIIDSPTIWVVEGEHTEAISLMSESIELSPNQDLTTVELKIVRND